MRSFASFFIEAHEDDDDPDKFSLTESLQRSYPAPAYPAKSHGYQSPPGDAVLPRDHFEMVVVDEHNCDLAGPNCLVKIC